jgi:hypothetical protein
MNKIEPACVGSLRSNVDIAAVLKVRMASFFNEHPPALVSYRSSPRS